MVTGGCGFRGSNIAAVLLASQEDVFVVDNLSRVGAERNLGWLRSIGEFWFSKTDIRNTQAITEKIANASPDVIFHLAGQVAMTTSIQNPRLDFEVNAMGTLNVLEAVRLHVPDCVVIYSATNKVYGDLEWVQYRETDSRFEAVEFPDGFPETIPLDFHSPYGCSKGSADQYMLDYARMFGLKTVVFRHSSMYGGAPVRHLRSRLGGMVLSKSLAASEGNYQ